MGRHAYLIIANQNMEQLKFLISLLDDKRNDIYVIIDKKSKSLCNKNQDLLHIVQSSHLNLLSPLKIYWGGYSLIQAELDLIKAALSGGNYDYYHLLSGSDLPLVSQDEIHTFFDNHRGKEFITFSEAGGYEKIYNRVQYYYHLSYLNSRFSDNVIIKTFIKVFRKIDLGIQKVLQIDQWKAKNNDMDLKYGSQWFSITHELATYIIQNQQWIEDTFKDTYLCDELFLQTLVWNSPFKDNIFIENPVRDIPDELQGNLRYINWWDGSPYTWDFQSEDDIKQLKHGRRLGHLFSRKFNLSKEDINLLRGGVRK